MAEYEELLLDALVDNTQAIHRSLTKLKSSSMEINLLLRQILDLLPNPNLQNDEPKAVAAQVFDKMPEIADIVTIETEISNVEETEAIKETEVFDKMLDKVNTVTTEIEPIHEASHVEDKVIGECSDDVSSIDSSERAHIVTRGNETGEDNLMQPQEQFSGSIHFIDCKYSNLTCDYDTQGVQFTTMNCLPYVLPYNFFDFAYISMIVEVDDPYGFRLMVMEKNGYDVYTIRSRVGKLVEMCGNLIDFGVDYIELMSFHEFSEMDNYRYDLVIICQSGNPAANIILNHDFSNGLYSWHPNCCNAFVLSSKSRNSVGLSPTSGGNLAVVKNSTKAWHGLEQDIAGIILPGSKYSVSAHVGISGSLSGSTDVMETLKLVNCDSASYLFMGKAFVLKGKWELVKGKFSLLSVPKHVIFYLEGLPLGVELLIDSVVISCSGSNKSDSTSIGCTIIAGDDIIINPRFEYGLRNWSGRGCKVALHDSIGGGKIVPQTGKVFADATERTQSWDGIQQEIIRRLKRKLAYNVTSVVRIFGNNVKTATVQATLWVQTLDLREQYIAIAKVQATSKDWAQLQGKFLLNGSPSRVVIYLEGPPLDTDILGRYILVKNRKQTWIGPAQMLTDKLKLLLTYQVYALVLIGSRVSGPQNANIALSVDGQWVNGGQVEVKDGRWYEIGGSFRIEKQPSKVIIYIQGPASPLYLMVTRLHLDTSDVMVSLLKICVGHTEQQVTTLNLVDADASLRLQLRVVTRSNYYGRKRQYLHAFTYAQQALCSSLFLSSTLRTRLS